MGTICTFELKEHELRTGFPRASSRGFPRPQGNHSLYRENFILLTPMHLCFPNVGAYLHPGPSSGKAGRGRGAVGGREGSSGCKTLAGHNRRGVKPSPGP